MRSFTFIDLFAGIGGFHIAMESLGGKCVFASEIDHYARLTYEHNFKKINPELFNNNLFNDDIRKITPSELPDFDVLCAGFPCQPFSQAGYKRGFYDTHRSERGNLFFNIVEILEAKQPKAFFLENVRGIINHDNGKTFKIIQDILKNELGYSFYFQIIKASDFGLPQLRPRAFMIGFKNEQLLSNFSFPQPIPLKFTMSDVWGGKCDRDIGYTLRVGGRGSKIGDRRNWDHYLVDGEIRQIMPEQAKKMQGFPDNFEFPVPKSQAMKQLGNSVAVDAVKACATRMIEYMYFLEHINGENQVKNTKNKGEWTELYTFLKLLMDKKVHLADKNLNPKSDYLRVNKVTTLNIEQDCYLSENDTVKITNKLTGKVHQVQVSSFINQSVLNSLAESIKNGRGTFDIPNFHIISNKLGVTLIKGGNSNQKADIILDIENKCEQYNEEGFSIKSYLGGAPTLLNASGNTNFIFKVKNLSIDLLDKINSIRTNAKLKDRISAIYKNGGNLEFDRVEQTTMGYNLDLVDSMMPKLVAIMLLEFHKNRTNTIDENLNCVFEQYSALFSTDLDGLKVKVKKLLVAILLGFFAGSKWNGQYLANGTIVVKDDGSQLAYHITDLESLENYLYENIRFDTPSTTRHRYGSLILENGELYFKLNLQLRF
ncbi:TPA: HpaII family restriction endonuclease [Pasteurella multocida]|nr:HpaII family restriction endonuclease [Pasteurella multocida]MDY0634219.1 HpaII family restriction endonuclease [Pasteurella multocida]MDY0691988.1 HpaII family restriction endonuclease [Pasteurella multocida]HEA3279073.1 HpaII family restriction endonuclease [Pasteurella multocida]